MQPCPTEDALGDLAAGRLDAGSAAELHRHLRGCEACGLALAELADPDAAGEPPALAPGDRVGRFELVALLGSGSTGEVWSARDTELGRKVALKTLRIAEDAGAGDPAQDRALLREAQALAALSHPNLVTVLEVLAQEGRIFLALEPVAGGTLREWLAARARSLDEILDVFMDAARGLAAAHAAGLVHRDFKPDNVLLGEDGRVRVTDFGLARPSGTKRPEATSPELRAATRLTSSGQLVGVPASLAPEQLRGLPIDARADVFAFCASLHEAVSGARPFAARDFAELRRRMEKGEVSPAPQGSRVPAWLRRILLEGLRADPAERLASMDALLAALTKGRRGAARRRLLLRVGAVVALSLALALGAFAAFSLTRRQQAPGPPVVAVVADFDNQTGEPELDGLSGMLITALEQSPRLTVLTRARLLDLLREQGVRDPARIDERLGSEASRKTGAQALFLGSVRRFDRLYAVDLKVIDPRSASYLVALEEKGEGKESVPGLIARLSLRARTALQERQDEARVASASVVQATTRNLEAYQRYFKGANLLDRLRFAEARRELEAALLLDPDFAVGWYQLAYARYWLHDPEGSKLALSRALPLLDRTPEKERWLIEGLSAFLGGDFERGLAAYQSCLARFPQEKECAFSAGDLLYHGGRREEAIRYLERALELDGEMERAAQHLARAHQLAGRLDDVLRVAQRYSARVSTDQAISLLGRARVARGELDRARETFLLAADRFPASALPLLDLARLEELQGRRADAERTLLPLLDPARPPRDRFEALRLKAEVILQEGRVHEALAALEQATLEASAAGDENLRSGALASRGVVEQILHRDTATAQKLYGEARAQGLPLAPFRVVLPLTGDFDQFEQLLVAIGEPLAKPEVRAYRARAEGKLDEAAALFADLAERSPAREDWLFALAEVEEAAGKPALATRTLERAIREIPPVDLLTFGHRVYAFKATAGLALARLAEQQGKPQQALEHVERFLAQWAHADEDLPDLAEARALRARLVAVASRPTWRRR